MNTFTIKQKNKIYDVMECFYLNASYFYSVGNESQQTVNFFSSNVPGLRLKHPHHTAESSSPLRRGTYTLQPGL